ncbi:MAG: hypothetical protein FH756_18910 [Firmicutes bacterium]|nr:hypothetical protein [Bacillota bacterium]
MQKYLNKVGYGNQQIGDKIDMFWLDNSLKISANEQLDFITNLYQEDLPFDKRNINIVKNILINQKAKTAIQAGKTGACIQNGKVLVGWYVGYAVSDGKPYTFVTRIEKLPSDDSPKIGGWVAKRITKNILSDLNILAQ